MKTKSKDRTSFSVFLWGRGLTRQEWNFVCRSLVFCHCYMAFHFLFPVYLLLAEIPSVHKVKKIVHYLSMFYKAWTFKTWTYDMLIFFFLTETTSKIELCPFLLHFCKTANGLTMVWTYEVQTVFHANLDFLKTEEKINILLIFLILYKELACMSAWCT